MPRNVMLALAALLTSHAGSTTDVAPAPVDCRTPATLDPDAGSAAFRRHNAVQSDSLWLIKRVRELYPDRLAGTRLEGINDGRLRLVFRFTGSEKVPPMRLADRARDVPVVVEYGARHSLKQVESIRSSRQVREGVRRLLPGLQGEGYDEASGTIRLDVFAPDEKAARRALGQCAALRALYDMPVEIVPGSAELH